MCGKLLLLLHEFFFVTIVLWLSGRNLKFLLSIAVLLQLLGSGIVASRIVNVVVSLNLDLLEDLVQILVSHVELLFKLVGSHFLLNDGLMPLLVVSTLVPLVVLLGVGLV